MRSMHETLTILGQLRRFREQFPTRMSQIREDRQPRAATLLMVPRQYALEIIHEYAAETGKPLSGPHEFALRDARTQQDVLLMVDGIPVLCGEMSFRGFAGWTWTLPGVLATIEESSRYPGLPWVQSLETSPEDMFRLTRTALQQAIQIIQTRPASWSLPMQLAEPITPPEA